ncbi:MAG: hypothetical protein R2690_00965 [Acidimicrobiales bacterium]
MSLRARLALILGATVALTVALASTAGYVLTRNELRQQADELLETRAEAVTRELERRGAFRAPTRTVGGLPPPGRAARRGGAGHRPGRRHRQRAHRGAAPRLRSRRAVARGDAERPWTRSPSTACPTSC